MDLEERRKQIKHYFATINPRAFAKEFEHNYPDMVVQIGIKKRRTTPAKLKRIIKKINS